MNIKFIDDLTFNIYVKKEQIKNINTKINEEIELFLKELIKKIKKIYNINIEGFYDVYVYIDKYYGIIFNFNKEKLEYYDCFNSVEMSINIKNVDFLYKVNDVPINILKKIEVKNINNNLYIKINKELNKKEFMNLMEHTEKIIKI